jgi:hypothetical protein
VNFRDRIPRLEWRDTLTDPATGVDVWGLYDPNTGDIEMHRKQRGKRLLETFVHEFLHHRFPEFTEEKVTEEGKAITDWLWRNGYRRQAPKPQIDATA